MKNKAELEKEIRTLKGQLTKAENRATGLESDYEYMEAQRQKFAD